MAAITSRAETGEAIPWWTMRPSGVGATALCLALGGAALSLGGATQDRTRSAVVAMVWTASLVLAASAWSRERSAAVAGTAGAATGIVVTGVAIAFDPALAPRAVASTLFVLLVSAVAFSRWLARRDGDERTAIATGEHDHHALRNALFTVEAATWTLERRGAELSPEAAAELTATARRGIGDLRMLILDEEAGFRPQAEPLRRVADVR